ncbi:MAG TPA: hypothetical protein VK166_06845 [Chitinophagaceae bacterium]|nr:hypothetical protein [Chitinophagaceae bacterium]
MRRFFLTVALFTSFISFSQAKPIISFFNELKTPELVNLFSDSSLIPTLKQLNAEIRMGMLDLTPERAAIVRRLTDGGVPVVAWLLLPVEKGYFFHAGNGDLAIQRYIETRKWAEQYGLKLKGMGLDLELDLNDVELGKKSPGKLVWTMYKRLYDKTVVEEGRKKYAELIAMIQEDGYMVESYYASFIKDEVKLGNTSIQQFSQFLDVKTDREIPMLYSSFMGNADGLMKIYGMDVNAKEVGIGSTGGGIDTTMPTLSYEELVHGMNIASRFADELHIFSLEGCVQKGYLTKLLSYQYDPGLTLDQKQVRQVRKIQNFFKFMSSVLSYPTLLLIGILLLILFVIGLVFIIIRFLVRLATRLVH